MNNFFFSSMIGNARIRNQPVYSAPAERVRTSGMPSPPSTTKALYVDTLSVTGGLAEVGYQQNKKFVSGRI
jgi:hypothetical protein